MACKQVLKNNKILVGSDPVKLPYKGEIIMTIEKAKLLSTVLDNAINFLQSHASVEIDDLGKSKRIEFVEILNELRLSRSDDYKSGPGLCFSDSFALVDEKKANGYFQFWINSSEWGDEFETPHSGHLHINLKGSDYNCDKNSLLDNLRFLKKEIEKETKRQRKFVNLTPHEINICDEDGEILTSLPSKGVARVNTKEVVVDTIDNINVVKTKYLDVVDLPPPQLDTIYLVSILVLQALKGKRSDVLAPNTSPRSVIRDDKGQIKGVKSFTTL